MALTALESVYRALPVNLKGVGNWGDRVYPDQAPANVQRPYVIFFWAGGGEANWTRHNDADLIISVKCVANTMQESMTGAGLIAAALNDKGTQDSTSPLVNGADWTITTVTSDRVIHMVEAEANAVPIYHDGAQYRVILQKN